MKDPLLFNKLAAAFLLSMIFAVAPRIILPYFSGEGHHGTKAHGEDSHSPWAYAIEYSLPGTQDAGQKKEVPFSVLLARADPGIGGKRAAICKSCHTFEQGGPNTTGPNLWNVMQRPVASVPGFAYSQALQALEGSWTFDTLDAFIANSKAFAPGTTMAQKIRKPQHRAEILAFMNSLSDTPLAIPEPPAEDLAALTDGEN